MTRIRRAVNPGLHASERVCMVALARTLLYGGLSPEEFKVIRDDIVVENRRELRLYTPIACISFCILSVTCQLTEGPAAVNLWIYVISCLAMGVILAGTILLDHITTFARQKCITVLVYAFMTVLYVFSIAVSAMHAEYPAVSAIAFLLVTPLLFVDRPIRVMVTTVVAVIAICVTSSCMKSDILAIDDVWNAITFGAVTLPLGIFIQRMRLTQLYQARMIAYLSENDTLTGLNNRNSFESRLEDYPQSGAKVLVCAYADANGLREMNNSKGHEAGDALLRAIANEMRKSFGKRDTYRIGGDEFVAIIPDGDIDEIRRELQRMQVKLVPKGYSVSCGASSIDAKRGNMRLLVREAEQEMYVQKRKYHGNDYVG